MARAELRRQVGTSQRLISDGTTSTARVALRAARAWRHSRAAACCLRPHPADCRACDGPRAGDRRARRRPAGACGARDRDEVLPRTCPTCPCFEAAISGSRAAMVSGAASRPELGDAGFRLPPGVAPSSAPCPDEAAADGVPLRLHDVLLGPPVLPAQPVRGSEAGDLFGQRLVGGAGELAHRVEITPGQAVEIGWIVVFKYARTIADRGSNAAFARAKRPCRIAVSALR